MLVQNKEDNLRAKTIINTILERKDELISKQIQQSLLQWRTNAKNITLEINSAMIASKFADKALKVKVLKKLKEHYYHHMLTKAVTQLHLSEKSDD